LWNRTPALRRRVAIPFGDERLAGSLVVTLAALHDLGKFTLPFQIKVPELWLPEFGPFPSQAPPDIRHDAAGAYLLKLRPIEKLLVNRLGPAWESLSDGLLQAVVGHHGRPVGNPQVAVASIAPPFLMAAVTDYVEMVLARFMPEPLGDRMSAPTGHRWQKVGELASWPLSGLIVLADWVGSNQEWFPYADPETAEDAYWEDAQRLAKRAVDRCGIGQAAPRAFAGLATLIKEANTPSPMQQALAEMALPDGRFLTLIEDVTGSGKTEAAIGLAWRLLAEGAATGIVFALPTMATANAMFDRIAGVARTLFAEDASPTLALAHGKAWLHRGFRGISLGVGAPTQDEPDDELADDGAFTCPAWLADESRKAFLADLGVSTIDQALLAVLARKFQSVRLAGLIGKVLIVDEVHAYDSYMLAELERLLTFHAALGGSAIILSATLPLSRRRRLAAAFAAGLETRPPIVSAGEFPLLTVISGAGAEERGLAVREGLARRVGVRLIHDVAEAYDRVAEAARLGAAVAYLRNTVDDVLDAADELAARGVPATVFHARFTAADRAAIEGGVLSRFGPSSTGNRSGVVVASQVIEQSLDLDFDLFVTDLAPIDLLIQRAGRLWRHARSGRPLAAPELIVVSPPPVADAGKDWFRGFFPRASGIYPNHARLWLTAKLLAEKGAVVTPGESRALIEAVYGEDAIADAPAALERIGLAAEGEDHASAAIADLNLLDYAAGYSRSTGAWDSDVRTPTRLGGERVTLRLARFDGTAIHPFADEPDRRRAWAMSEISVGKNWLRRAIGDKEFAFPAPVEAAIAAERLHWPRFERGVPILPLVSKGGGNWRSLSPVEALTYDPSRGFRKVVEKEALRLALVARQSPHFMAP
jgi:CRISPR-associated endonuclease/helicase Cas3